MICAGITYSSGVIYISYDVSDGEKGLSFDNPYRFADIYDTDHANGWGVIFQKNGNQYFVDAGIYISGVSTHFKDAYGQVKFKNSIGGFVNFLYVYDSPVDIQNYDFIRDLSGGIGGIRIRGVYSGITPCIFNCTFRNIYNVLAQGNARIEKSICYNLDSSLSLPKNYGAEKPVVKDLSIFNSNIEIRESPAIFENISVYHEYPLYVLPSENEVITLKNINAYESNYKGEVFGWKPNASLVLIDSKLYGEWVWVAFGNYEKGDLTIYEKTTFKASIKNSTGGVLTIKGKDGNLIYTENLETEFMTEQELTFYKEYRAHENSIYLNDPEITENQPFTLVAEKTGYQTLTIPNITVTPGEPTIIRGAMVKNRPIDNNLSNITKTKLKDNNLILKTNLDNYLEDIICNTTIETLIDYENS